MAPIKPLPPDALYAHCDARQFSFTTTAELEDLKEIVGQDRAIEALRFGVGIKKEGYNLYVLGPTGIGKHTVVRQYLDQQAADKETPTDWCYVNNFSQAHKPAALRLPPGRGQELQKDMQHLIEELRAAIPAAFETEEYHSRTQEIEEGLKQQREHAFSELADEAEKHSITLLRTPGGFAFAPVKDGEVVSPDDYQKLPQDEQKRIEQVVANLQEKLRSILRQQPVWRREAREQIKALNRETARLTVDHPVDDLKKKYAELETVRDYLDAIQNDVIEHVEDFRGQDEEESKPLIQIGAKEKPSFRRYEVNLLVDNGDTKGAPVFYEDSPLYQNLVGRVEHLAQLGALVTDFMLIKPGALHCANGGYLMLDAFKVLTQPFAWEGLKRALRAREIRIQSLGEMYSLVSTVSLEPEPIPLEIKVVLIGDRLLYYLLSAYDPEFGELFKVAADFEERIDRSLANDQIYARLIATLARREDLLPLDPGGVARVIEHSARLIEDAEKLSTRMLDVVDLLREADYWARETGQQVISREDVQRAVDTQVRRADRVRERIHDEIRRGTILIDTVGERVSQVNGLSVLQLGRFSFGQPARITATARLGEGEVVDIEREVELGGAIHSKGVLILSSFLAARYSSNFPLSLSASLVFEQSYGMVEGDSASVAELCALLSALAGVPIRQWLAVTGSVNQHGQVQAIGSVNEKVEGFYDICKAHGLTGSQGVLIPAANVQHLMLREDVVAAVRADQFQIYPLQTIDQAIELLTGVPAGEADAEGNFPTHSINHRVASRLEEFAHLRQEYIKTARGESDEQPETN